MDPSPQPRTAGARAAPLGQLLALAGVLAIGGCADESPTAPRVAEPGPAAPVSARVAFSADERSALITALLDAQTRLVPALEEAAASAALAASLAAVGANLRGDGELRALETALADASAALAAYRARPETTPADATHLTVIALALGRLETALASDSEANTPNDNATPNDGVQR